MKLILVPEHKKVKQFNKNNHITEAFDFSKSSVNQNIESSLDIQMAIAREELLVSNVKAWLNSHNVRNYDIECSGHGIRVAVKNHLNLANHKLVSLPTTFRFTYIAGNCNLSNNRFTSFKNFPIHIKGDCICTFNYIQDFSGEDLPTIDGTLFAEKQRCHTKYKLSDENFRKYIAGTLNELNLVQIMSTGQYGTLLSINESVGTANVLINDEIPYQKNISINDIDVINGITYLEQLINRQHGR